MFDKLQFIPGWFSDIKWKIDFLTSKKTIFENFWGHFLLILDAKAEKMLKVGYFAGLKQNFETLNQKSAPKDLSEMFWRLFWYVSHGHTTNIGLGIH